MTVLMMMVVRMLMTVLMMMVVQATLTMRLDVSRAGMLVRVFRKVLWGLWGVPPFVWQINHFGDGHIDSLAALKLWRHRAESEGDLVSLEWYEVAFHIRDVNKMLG